MEMRIIDTHCDTIGECIARSQGKITLQNNPGHINVEKLQKGGALAEFFAIFIQKTTSQSTDASNSTIIGSRTSNRYGNITKSSLQSIPYHLTRSIRSCISRIPFLIRNQRKARCRSHFHNCPFFIQHTIAACQFFP